MTGQRSSDEEHEEHEENDESTMRFGYLRSPDLPQTIGPAVQMPRRVKDKLVSIDRDIAPRREPKALDHNLLDAAGEFKIGKLPLMNTPAAPAPPPVRRQPVPSVQAPVVFSSQSEGSNTLTGSTRPEGAPDTKGLPTKQWSGPLLRLEAPRRTSPDKIGHRVEVRGFLFFDGRDVTRYGVFVDPDEGLGFDGSGRAASYFVRVRESNLFRYGIGGPGRVEIAWSGKIKVAGFGELHFEGRVAFDADGKVSFHKPRVTRGGGRLRIEDGVVVIGWQGAS